MFQYETAFQEAIKEQLDSQTVFLDHVSYNVYPLCIPITTWPIPQIPDTLHSISSSIKYPDSLDPFHRSRLYQKVRQHFFLEAQLVLLASIYLSKV